MDIKHLGTDLRSLNKVKIFDSKGKLVKVVEAKRIDFSASPFQNSINHRKKRKKAKSRAEEKAKAKGKMKASDLLEI